MACKDCRGPGSGFGTQISDVRQLYSPVLTSMKGRDKIGCCDVKRCGLASPYSTRTKCIPDCRNKLAPCCDRYKRYWARNSEVGCQKVYEDQPWFKDPVIDCAWDDFVDDIATPSNIACKMVPGPNDYEFNCNKVRALFGPQVYCTWDLPDQDECGTIKYGYNRDWRRYNDDQRKLFSDIKCGCSNEPICAPRKSCEWPPYLGKMYGARYMSWAHPHNFMFSRPRVFNYQSNPTWCA